eukprot:m.107787 g.107787  ORF g.107787 m.107787 type:complete len:328 (-) comp8989_c0_seq2:336-1319(-)
MHLRGWLHRQRHSHGHRPLLRQHVHERTLPRQHDRARPGAGRRLCLQPGLGWPDQRNHDTPVLPGLVCERAMPYRLDWFQRCFGLRLSAKLQRDDHCYQSAPVLHQQLPLVRSGPLPGVNSFPPPGYILVDRAGLCHQRLCRGDWRGRGRRHMWRGQQRRRIVVHLDDHSPGQWRHLRIPRHWRHVWGRHGRRQWRQWRNCWWRRWCRRVCRRGRQWRHIHDRHCAGRRHRWRGWWRCCWSQQHGCGWRWYRRLRSRGQRWCRDGRGYHLRWRLRRVLGWQWWQRHLRNAWAGRPGRPGRFEWNERTDEQLGDWWRRWQWRRRWWRC